MWIKWNLKDVRALLADEIGALIAPGGAYTISHRLRESYALQLQQHLLADIGRVGVLAPMPATFPVTIEVATYDADGKVRKLNTPRLDREGGVCFTGRDQDGNEHTRLVVTDEAVDELLAEIGGLEEGNTHLKSHHMLKNLHRAAFGEMLQRGLVLPPTMGKWSVLKADIVKESGGTTTVDIAWLCRNPSPDQSRPGTQAALMIELRDTVPEGAAAAAIAVLESEEQVGANGE
jgi:hypothetical protein